MVNLKDLIFKNAVTDIEALIVALRKYQLRKERGLVTDKEVYQDLGITKKMYEDRMRKFIEYYGDDANNYHKNNQREELYRRIELLLNLYGSLIFEGTLKIQFGLNKCFNGFAMQNVVRLISEECTRRSIDVEFVLQFHHSKQLFDKMSAGELDLVLASCPRDFNDAGIRRDVTFRLHLVVARGSGLTRNNLDWTELAQSGRAAVLINPHNERMTMPDYPIEELESAGIQIRYVDEYDEMHKLIMSNNNLFCFSFPEIFDLVEHRSLEAIRIPGRDRRLRICLIRSEASRRFRSDTDNKTIDILELKLKEYISEIISKIFNDDIINKLEERRKRFIYHVRAISTSSGAKSLTYRWTRGDIELRFTRQGFVQGVHTVDLSNANGGQSLQSFQLFGHVNKNKQNQCHMILQGNGKSVDYAASFVFAEHDLHQDRPALVGVWVSRWLALEDFNAAGGYIVVSNVECQNSAELNRIVEDHKAQYRDINLVLPDKSSPIQI